MRLFVALTPPPPVQRAIWEAFRAVRLRDLPVKWVSPEGVHLTLKFLGEVPDERGDELIGAMGAAATGVRPISLVVRGAGAFPDPSRPRVFWAGVEPDPLLELLAHQVESGFAALGFPTEGRPFRPHLTVGRARRNARPRDFEAMDRVLEGVRVEAEAVLDGVDLVQSKPGPEGSVYHTVHRERLS
ncbi:MAG TPA: RNA 2',3'-cyclic phosphodiesterase [Gemmatimonadales bacterium]|nr:RNA 2',3'-cyclic phosphodiesterase [Gemmatimonadales bacterium]